MSKKIIIIVTISLLFLASIYVGFRAASRMNEHVQKPDRSSAINSSLTQQNYLVFHISDINGDSPFLISVWGLFINNSLPARLVFVSLYPSTDDELANNQFSSFKLQRDATLPDRLIAKIEREYDLEVNGYFVVDNFAVTSIQAWMGQNPVRYPQEKPLSTQEFQSIISNSENSFSSLCTQINQVGIESILDSIHWTDILPGHFSTSLTVEEWLLAVNTLTAAETIESCEVFLSQ